MKPPTTIRPPHAAKHFLTTGSKLLCLAALTTSTVTAHAADAARGAQLYMRTDSDVQSCVACHGPDPGMNRNNIQRAADKPDTLTRVLSTVSAMGFLGSYLSDVDRADIAAYLGTVTRSQAADAGLRIWPLTADFGAIPPAGSSAIQTVRLHNPSRTVAVAVTSITGSNPQLELSHDCPSTLAASSSCDVQMRVKPGATGLVRAALQISSPALPTPFYAGVLASGRAEPVSQLEWQDSEAVVKFDAGSTPPTLRRVISLANRGSMPAVLGLTSVVGSDAARFSVESGCSQGSILQSGTQCNLTLLYTPSLLPLVQATLQIRSDQSNPSSVRLEGVAAPSPAVSPPAELLVSGGSGGGCSTGPPGQRVFDPVLLLAATLAAWALNRRRRNGRRK